MNRKVIFCFTHAGGTTAFFDKLEEDLDDKIDLVKLEYPGHGKKHLDRLCSDFFELSKCLYPHIKDYVKKNNILEYGLLGYSMGTIAAFDMLRMIESCNEIPLPEHVFFAAHEPKTSDYFINVSENIIDSEVKNRTIEYGAVPDRLKDNAPFWRLYLPVYKADYQMIAKYSFKDIGHQFCVPTTIFYSENDTPIKNMELWNNYFAEQCEFIEYNGSHFFINDHYNEMAKIILDRMECH